MSGNLTLSVIIPVYNERDTIERVVERVKAVPVRTQIIIVDDCSTDGTREILARMAKEQPDLTIRYHEYNRGKGAAIRTALEEVRGDVVVIQDADMEYDPSEYPRLLAPIEQGVADVVYGSRFLGGPHRVLYFWHQLGNRILTLLSNMLTNLNLTDMETGYKVFRTEVIRSMRLTSNRFGFEPEVTARVAQMGCRVYELPISYWGRDYESGKKITWRDGVAALWHIFKYNVLDRMPASQWARKELPAWQGSAGAFEEEPQQEKVGK
ncbi:MAG: glycosyltransferase family 2 protein [Candidatus Dadabacteria bacterium]|nr:MAG: glycosyltransferase family 2 protein [Candidatus Dadabacteria bacterium]